MVNLINNNYLEEGNWEKVELKNSGPIDIIETPREKEMVLENQQKGIEFVVVNKELAKVAQLAQVDYLKGQLNDNNTESILNSCQERFNDWKEYFQAISRDKKAIENKMKSLGNDSISKLLNSIDTSFLYLENVDDKKLKEEYLKYFEWQNSQYSLWSLIVAVEANSFSKWFFSAMNWFDQKIENDEKFKNIINIVQRLVNISNKI